mgnify:CR=1 FL=1
MKKFEYLRIVAKIDHPEPIETKLNFFGDLGWEIFQSEIANGYFYGFAKREKAVEIQ